jgi:hypothetical protein
MGGTSRRTPLPEARAGVSQVVRDAFDAAGGGGADIDTHALAPVDTLRLDDIVDAWNLQRRAYGARPIDRDYVLRALLEWAPDAELT